MLLGALLHAGVSEDLLRRTVAALNIGAELRISRTDRSGISATKVDVLVNGERSESSTHSHHAEHVHGSHEHNENHGHSHHHDHDHENSHERRHLETQHAVSSASHSKSRAHSHGRSLSVIREIIRNAELTHAARETAIRAFELLGEAEAAIHNVPIELIHFHEVGAVDAIVDIVCAAVGCQALGVDEFICSPLNVGSGSVKCAHGEFPVPAPATLALLKDAPVYSSGIDSELVTPTGAALIRALNCRFSAFPSMSVQSIGYGAGSRNPSGHPNVLRISVGELAGVARPADIETSNQQDITVLETTIDDLSPQILGYVTERLLADGALDVFVVPVQMKKNRPGSLLIVLCDEDKAPSLREILFRETTTIGIRTRRESRDCLERSLVPVTTQWGVVRVKESRLNGAVTNSVPEYEDCRRIAEAHSIPLKQVQQEAMIAYSAHKQPSSGESVSNSSGAKSQVA